MKNPPSLVFTGLEGIFYSFFLQNSGFRMQMFNFNFAIDFLIGIRYNDYRHRGMAQFG